MSGSAGSSDPTGSESLPGAGAGESVAGSRLRVLLIANTLPPKDVSGVGEQVLQLASGLRALGHEVRVLGRGPGGARGPKVLFPLAVMGPTLRAVASWRPDVVQVHESDGALAAAVARALRWSLRRKLFLVALQQVSYRREVAVVRPLRDGDRVISEPGAVERRFLRFKAPLQVALGQWTARQADLVLAPSLVTAAELRQDYGVSEATVLPNVTGGLAVEPVPMDTAMAHTPENTTGNTAEGTSQEPGGFFLFVGRLRVRKGVEVLLEALARMRQRRREEGGPELPRLLVVGDGEHRPAIEAARDRLGLKDSVRLLGRASAGEVRWLLARARALVVPSTYEGMPLVILEAMEAGVPVVASAVSGIPEVVVDCRWREESGLSTELKELTEFWAEESKRGVEETGWLVPPEDAASLAKALEETLAEEGAMARQRGAAGRRRLEALYRPRHGASRWQQLIQDRLDRRT
ncbi:MAG: glycosyltransferase family 4 protein [Acidobacteriota bacterium]